MLVVGYKKWEYRPVEFKKSSRRPVDFKESSCRMSLKPKKGCVAMSILGVYTPSLAFSHTQAGSR